MARELIILVPGLVRVSRSAQLTKFVDGLKAGSERMPLKEIADDTVPHGVHRLQGKRGREEVEIDVKEAYWNDLVPSLTQESLKTKVIRGLSLIWYWTISPVWIGFLKRKYLTFGMALSVIAFIAWYLSTLVLLVEALASNPPGVLAGITPSLKAAVDSVGGWRLWVFTSALVGFLPVAILVDISDFAKRYITNEPISPDRPKVRSEIIRQVREQVSSALERKDYALVTVVGHSFGSVVVVDLLADLPPLGLPLRVVTMGSIIELLAKRASWLENEVCNLVKRSDLEEWVDINSRSDWFASGSGASQSEHYREVPVKSFGTFVDKVAAQVHSRYFDNQSAVREVLRTSDHFVSSGG